MTDQNASIDMNETSSTRPNNSVDGINNANFKKANTNSSSSKNTNQRIHTSKDRQLINVVVSFLDESTTVFQVDHKALGRTLFYQVCESLNLIEVDYFGLSYVDSHGIQYWLDFEKPICKQLSLSSNGPNLSMSFSVKFYTIEPSSLEDDLTRYLFALQIKKDLADGNLLCSENVAALLSSYIIQAECGDYNVEEYSNHFYISKFKLLPQQDDEFEFKVMENHKKLIGLSPGEADLQLLEFAKQLDMYGIKLSPVKDHEGVPLNLSVIHNGILIFQNHTKVNTFEWLKVRKLSFKRKRFFIKLHQEEFFGDVLEFVFQHRNECKNFWKKCIEQHSFFKCYEIKAKSRQKLRIFSRGSSFRYAGRTQQQISEYIKSNNAAATRNAKQKAFQRSSSMKLPDSTIKEEDCFGYSSDMNDTPNSGSLKGQDNNPDSISYTTSCNTMRQMYKSCDTIDQESVCQSSSTIGRGTDFGSHIITEAFQNMNLSNTNLQSTLEFRGFKRSMNQDYYVFRDLVMSERTFLKDLELMHSWFKNDVAKEPSRSSEILSLLFNVSEPLIDLHRSFLTDIEYLLYIWDKDGVETLPPLSKILGTILKWLTHYEQFIERLPFILEQINSSLRLNRDFERICREFETKKGCYTPYSSFLLKPAFHVVFYGEIIQKLIDCICPNHFDYKNLKNIVEQLDMFNLEYDNTLDSLINLVILIELQRDITGFDNIVQSGRRFIREGCLLKLSKKGFQQRLFFLFSDVLIYASRSTSMNYQFKIHGYFSLYNVFVEESESKCGNEHCFTIFAGNKIIILAAFSEDEKQAWMQDIKSIAINRIQSEIDSNANGSGDSNNNNGALASIDQHWTNPLEFDQLDKMQSRTNTIVHVCWQRACSISYYDYRYALTVSFSGYLLRKFKNCSGWQKLWVEFTHFCLFFYKTSDDDFPLASLPVIGYTVSVPNDADNMRKNYVFKLQFKTHIYFFRAESEYAFTKWMQVIQSTMTTNKESLG
ncbi:hypothetical protein RDWZM_001063 [Blomia tropicalis]|uniref:Moesin/ezrin/radixin homolog 1 n=1 Tax=Blomia tropicalis TaxID=40697 RepID=A0A9Q0RNL0_BLOTA|nr:hypothetical protein RDWZM_001063 [Blomia tropicalis]